MPTITGTNNDDLITTLTGGTTALDVIVGLAGDDTIDYVSTGNDLVYGGSGDDFIDLSAPSVIAGFFSANNTVYGDGGNDTLIGTGFANLPQDDTLYGGAGNDSINARYGSDTIYGGDGEDLLDGRFLVATAVGGIPAVQTYYGGAGDDSIWGYEGDDTIFGGAGNDVISSNFARLAPTPGGDLVYGGAGDDTITTFASQGSVQSSVGDTVYGGAGNDSILGAIDAPSGSDPTQDDDFLFGGIGNDIIDGNRGTDFIDAGAGDDTVIARAGQDTTDGGTGVDLIDFRGDDGRIVFDMTTGLTTVTGTATVTEINSNYENVIATGLADTVLGNAADNSIAGGAGADLLTGGAGSDTLNSGAGDDSIVGGEDGPANPDGSIDVIDYSNESNGINVRYTGDEAGTAQGTSTGTDTFIEIERIIFSAADDSVNAFNDTIGVTLATGAGADFVEAGQGDDSLDGGAGIDELSYADSNAGVTVDAAAGTASGTGTGNDTIQGFEDFALTGSDDTFTGSNDSETVTGGDGNDSLDGGGGTDTLYGGAGEDRIDGGAGIDFVFGGDGNDTIIAGLGDVIDGGGSANGDNIPGDFDTLDVSGLIPTNGAFIVLPDLLDDENGLITILDLNGITIGTISYTEIENIVCFTRGTMIATPDGEKAIEDLAEGDLVLTRDNGAQPIRWIGSRALPAFGNLAPVVIAKGALDNDRELRVSQLHRMLISDWRAELMFGETEVLAAAKHLVNGDTIYVAEGGEVEYFHMLFDQHEIVTANGAASESFHPGEQGMSWLEQEIREEIFTIFPELRANADSYGPAARTSLRAFEARALRR